MPDRGRGSAPARAALAGNPSDGYGGAVLAVAVPAFGAEAEAVASSAGGREADQACELVAASVARFDRELYPEGSSTVIEWSTTIPRSVGLGGSSAIVIATLRALCDRYGVTVGADALAELALSIEVDDLGIAAGLQDRVAQCYGGVTFMEFGASEPHYERLDGVSLPPMLVAWLPASAAPSGVVHGDLRRRYEAGESQVQETMASLAEEGRRARDALVRGDQDSLRRCVDATFDLRARILDLDPRHVQMVKTARAAGAAANYTGSGGAIVCVCHDPHHRSAVGRALRGAACGTIEL